MYFFSQLLSYQQLISEWRILNQTYYRTKGNEKKNTPCTKRHLAIKELLSNPMKRSGGRKKKKNPKEEKHRVLGLLFYRLFLASGPRALTLLLRNAWPILHDEALLARTCIYVLLCCWPILPLVSSYFFVVAVPSYNRRCYCSSALVDDPARHAHCRSIFNACARKYQPFAKAAFTNLANFFSPLLHRLPRNFIRNNC